MHSSAQHVPEHSRFLSTDAVSFLHSPQSGPVHARLYIVEGLAAPQARVAPKYFYDSLGSLLFEAICALPEYYPTRTESAILDACLPAIADGIPSRCTLIDLGAGNCMKAAKLIPALQPACYVPIDISAEFLRTATVGLRQRFPELPVLGVGMDFSSQLALPHEVPMQRRLFFYPGSSIGNFAPAQARSLLGQMRAHCDEDGGLLIGIDLVKPRTVMEAAYNDGLGVTAAFNLNLLRHLNQIAGTDFDPAEWRHYAFFNEDEQRIEMHLVARRALTVRWEGGERRFEEGESIHTESSCKYTREAFLAMLESAGFAPRRDWRDPHDWFMVVHAQAR